MQNFSLLHPITIKTENIVATNVADNEHPEWEPGTYLLGQRVHVNLGDLHYIYESTVNANTAAPDATKQLFNNWARVSSTNKYKAFDPSISTQTIYPEYIEYTISGVGRFNSLWLGNVDGANVVVSAKNSSNVTIYNKTISIIPLILKQGWFAYRYGRRAPNTELFIDDMPINSYSITIRINNAGKTAKLGVALIGVNKYFGNTQFGAAFSIKDYSYVATDDYGNTVSVQRVYGKTTRLAIWVKSEDENYFADTLTAYRSKFVLFRGAVGRKWLTNYGICKWDAELSYATETIFSLNIEGST